MGSLKKIFISITSILTWTEEAFLCLLLFAMIVLACVQIFLRTFYASGILWIDPLLRYMVIWAGLFGAAVATKHSKHISIDVISHIVPDKYLPWLRFLLNFFSAAVCFILTYAAVKFASHLCANWQTHHGSPGHTTNQFQHLSLSHGQG